MESCTSSDSKVNRGSGRSILLNHGPKLIQPLVRLDYGSRGSGPFSQQPMDANTAQLLTHLQQHMHFSLSTVGALKPSCEMAPTGQSGNVGHAWFCGHSSLRMTIISASYMP